MTRSHGNVLVFDDERKKQMTVKKLDESNRLFAVEVDMENRSPEDIARDAALQIGELFDSLIKEQKKKEREVMKNEELFY